MPIVVARAERALRCCRRAATAGRGAGHTVLQERSSALRTQSMIRGERARRRLRQGEHMRQCQLQSVEDKSSQLDALAQQVSTGRRLFTLVVSSVILPSLARRRRPPSLAVRRALKPHATI